MLAPGAGCAAERCRPDDRRPRAPAHPRARRRRVHELEPRTGRSTSTCSAWRSGTRPRICLLPTASGDPEDQIDRFYRTFEQHGCDLSHVSLFRLGEHAIDLRGHLLSRDVIYVGGGSLKNLLALWRVHGVDSLLSEAWQTGVALAGRQRRVDGVVRMRGHAHPRPARARPGPRHAARAATPSTTEAIPTGAGSTASRSPPARPRAGLSTTASACCSPGGRWSRR